MGGRAPFAAPHRRLSADRGVRRDRRRTDPGAGGKRRVARLDVRPRAGFAQRPGRAARPRRGRELLAGAAAPFEVRRAYIDQTNVLQTEFITAEGTVRVTDAATLDTAQAAPWRELVRRIEGVAGTVAMRWRLRPRFGFGRHSVEPVRWPGGFLYRHGQLQLGVRCWDAGAPEADR